MKVIDSLKLNKFKPVSVPRNRDLYSRVGGRVPSMGTTGFVAELAKNKMQVLSDADSFFESEMLKDSQMPLDTQMPDK